MTDPSQQQPAGQPTERWMGVHEAFSFAARAHAGHTRKDGSTPYFAHPARVTLICCCLFGCDDPSVLCAAALHDTIEDTPADYDDIRGRFSEEVADIVAALSKNMLLPEPEREADYDARLARADWRARLIKLADVYDNLHDKSGASGAVGARLTERARRAIALAQPDVEHHPQTRRGVELINSLLGRS